MYTVIRVDGREELYAEDFTIDRIHTLLACRWLHVVNIGKANDPPDDRLLLVDDTGLLEGKPINPVATRLYRRVAPGSAHHIHGDVVLTYDRFLAGSDEV